MKRRRFLHLAAAGTALVAGCVSDESTGQDSTAEGERPTTTTRSPGAQTESTDTPMTDRPPEKPTTASARQVIPYSDLSEQAKEEVRVAVRDGEYTSDTGPAILGEINSSRALIEYRGRRYEPLVAVADHATESSEGKVRRWATYSLVMEPVPTTTAEVEGSPETPSATDYETTSIPVLESGGEVVATEQVPAEWRERNEQAEDVVREIQAEFGDVDGVRTIGVTSAKRTIGDLHYPAVRVGVTPDRREAIDERIPDRMNEIPINVVAQEYTLQNLSVPIATGNDSVADRVDARYDQQ